MLKGLEGVQEHWNQCRARLYNGGQTLTDVSAAIGETPVTRLMTEEINSSLESHQLLSLLMDVRDLLEPLSQAAKEKRKLLETIQQHDTIRVGILLGFSRRLGPNSRPPPEYNDPSGADAFCVPGYLFPCPDAQMMLRSVLFLGGASKAVLRCIPPDIDVELQPGTTSLVLTSATKGAEFYYSINQESLRKYNPEQKPILTAPADFSLQAYAIAEGYLPSELNMKLVKLKLATLQANGSSASPSSVTQGKTSVFGGLFLGGDDEDESEGDELSGDDAAP